MSRPTVALFDAYGTLFNVHSAVTRYASEMGSNAGSISQLWRLKQLEYTWTRSLMGDYTDFWTITCEALDHALAVHSLHDAALRTHLLDAYRQLDAYPEVAEVLSGYRHLGLRVGVFSNATPAMLQAALHSAELGKLVDTVQSVHQQSIYKPATAVYSTVTETLAVTAEEIVFHSSNAWDAAGAAVFGWRTLWINRDGSPREYPWAALADTCRSLREAPALMIGSLERK